MPERLESIMPLRIECPNCQTTLEIPENALGRQVQCPSCKGLISVAAEPEPESKGQPEKKPGRRKGKRRRDDDRPRRPTQKASPSNFWLFVGIGAAAVVGIIGIAVLLLWPRNNPKVTEDNYHRIETGMTLAAVEKILGSGREASVKDVKEIFDSSPDPDAPQATFEEGASKGSTYRWKNKKTYILVVFDGPPKSGGTVSASHFSTSTGDPPPRH
jgi:predicted Zn finger-like uncharacterized protein